MILNQPDFFARSATLDGAISDTDTQITLTGLSTRFTDAVAAGTVRYPLGPFRISDDDGFELIAITGHVSGTTFEVERGIQGTEAEAWADGTAVRAVVTSKSFLERPIALSSSIFIKDKTFVDTFERSNRDLHNDNGWNVFEESAEIVDGYVQSTNNFARFVRPNMGSAFGVMQAVIDTAPGSRAARSGFIPAWVDNQNYLYFFYEFGSFDLISVIDGEATTIGSVSPAGSGTHRGTQLVTNTQCYMLGRSDHISIHLSAAGQHVGTLSYDDVDVGEANEDLGIFTGATHWGYSLREDFSRVHLLSRTEGSY